MTGKTHMVGGAIVTTAVALAMPTEDKITPAILISSGVIGALLPDIDHPNSMLSKEIGIFRIPWQIFAWIFGKLGLATGHRGLTHSFIPWLLLSVPLMFLSDKIGWFGSTIWIGVILGALSHLIFDALNPSGIPAIYPFSKRRTHLLPKPLAITTKNMMSTKGICKEDIFAFICVVSEICLLFLLIKRGGF